MKILGLPSYDGKTQQAHINAVISALNEGLDGHIECIGSMLTRTFNTLWATALNLRKDGLTHFIMLHDDVVPEDGWFSIMMRLMTETEADVLSVIIPIKSDEGATSTAFDTGDGKWNIQRVMMNQLTHERTITHEKLLVNTGLMCVDFTKPWVEKVHFRFEDDIILNEKGEYKPRAMSEDWLFSRDARALGAKLFATNQIKVAHVGGGSYKNY